MKTSQLLVLLAAALVAVASGQQTILDLNKGTLSETGKSLGSQPIAFVAIIKLKQGADPNKFVAVREAVAKKARETYPNMQVAYIKVSYTNEGVQCQGSFVHQDVVCVCVSFR